MPLNPKTIACVLIPIAFTIWTTASIAQNYIIRPVEVPGASATYATANNNAGWVVGCNWKTDFFTSDEVTFLLDQGTFTKVRYPGQPQTCVWGLGNGGEIVGGYLDKQGYRHGFSVCGKTHTTIDYPGFNFTVVTAINGTGAMVGYYFDGSTYHGFRFEAGSFTDIDPPGAAASIPEGINDAGKVTGGYTENGHTHGYLLSAGTFTPIEYPGASDTDPGTINNSGDIVGAYTDSSGNTHGFLEVGATFTSLDYPGATTTAAFTINDSGQILGQWSGPLGYDDAHGFLATPITGWNGQSSSAKPKCGAPVDDWDEAASDAAVQIQPSSEIGKKLRHLRGTVELP